jgi:hypothetical protein
MGATGGVMRRAPVVDASRRLHEVRQLSAPATLAFFGHRIEAYLHWRLSSGIPLVVFDRCTKLNDSGLCSCSYFRCSVIGIMR